MYDADIRTAVSLDPENDRLRYRFAISLLETGEFAEAEEQARTLVARHPKDVAAINLLGVILKQQRKFPEAINEFQKASRREPSNVSPWVNLGNVYMLLEDYPKAVDHYAKALRLDPKHAENRRLLGCAYAHAGNQEKAIEHLQKAVSLARDPRALTDLVAVYCRNSQPEKGVEEADKLLTLTPNEPRVLRAKANALRKLRRPDEARAIYEAILQKDPKDAETLTVLGNLFMDAGDRQRANEHYERAVQADPENWFAASQYCECLLNSRYGNEAEHLEKAYRIAYNLVRRPISLLQIAGTVQGIFLRMGDYESLALLGDRQKLIQYWLNSMNVGELHNQLGRVSTPQDRLQLVEAHKTWGDKIIENIRRQPPLHRTPAGPREKIRVGLMSSDLRNHPVTYFVGPIIEHYDRSRIELYCYSFYPQTPDRVQQWIGEKVDRFNVWTNVTDREIAQKIADDHLDVLFELGGTTHLNRLQVCGYRPSPVQVSWLGYPHSSGISAIDYILVDPYLNPPDRRLLIEKPFVMPETWVTLGRIGFNDLPIEPGIPEERAGHLTFGTANNPYKYTPELIATWASIMNQAPGSHFLFVRPEGGTPSFRRNICGHFAKNGIDPKRTEFAAVRGKHMPFYNRIDIALDTFPHVGGTTTCETIWMGVPVVTLVGPAFFERLSYSNLVNAGLGDLCATTKQDYVRLAVQLAANRDRRRTLRHGLRDQIRQHPLGQPERFVRNFEKVTEQTLRAGKK